MMPTFEVDAGVIITGSQSHGATCMHAQVSIISTEYNLHISPWLPSRFVPQCHQRPRLAMASIVGRPLLRLAGMPVQRY